MGDELEVKVATFLLLISIGKEAEMIQVKYHAAGVTQL